MPFIPHTRDDVKAMLSDIGVETTADLFDEIPADLPDAALNKLPAGLSEGEFTRLMIDRAPAYKPGRCFIGAGAYEHHIPAAVWDITTRGEFYTAYTPYQAEVSQGTLQVIYEYQSMMTALMGMEVSNASMYEGASALSESILMALRLLRGKAKRILVPANLHPNYRKMLQTVFYYHDVDLVDWSYDQKTGQLDLNQLKAIEENQFAAVIIAQPNFFGGLEAVDAITDLAHSKNALLIASVNPMAMALLKAPGQWGETGADIVCGEGQPLGVPLSGGGPYFGFMCCRKKDVRQIPGRIVGRTQDKAGKTGFVLTLQAREQHIRRAKATSNICTNQGLLVTAATIYMRLMGASGLQKTALQSHQQAMKLKSLLSDVDGISIVFDNVNFHEFVIRVNQPIDTLVAKLEAQGFQAGYVLQNDFPELDNCLLVCATETKTDEDLKAFQQEFLETKH